MELELVLILCGIRSFGENWSKICGLFTDQIAHIENYANEVEKNVLQPLENVKNYLKLDREELEEKFTQTMKHLESCQGSAEKALRNVMKASELVEGKKESDLNALKTVSCSSFQFKNLHFFRSSSTKT
jgi:hypothetical protein